MRTGDYHGLFDYSPITQRPPLRWPNGARVAGFVVLNVEHYELRDAQGRIDARTASRTDYGNRVGIWRMIEALDRRNIPATIALNAAVCRHYPQVMEAMILREWEFMGHGLTNTQLLSGLSPEEGRSVVKETVDTIEQSTGRKVHGWLGPGLTENETTLDALVENGVQYVCDWVNDDQPYRMKNGLYSMPYTVDLNDMPLFREPSITPADFAQFICDAFDTLYREGETRGRVLCLALHPFLTGMPHRIGHFEKALDHICRHSHVWWARGLDILEAYKSAVEIEQ